MKVENLDELSGARSRHRLTQTTPLMLGHCSFRGERKGDGSDSNDRKTH